jgi:UDP-3-O-[3-hydroxymyristoyl] glucosamine N-acyltransferase
MADPRFYDNRGPFTLAEVCARAGVELPAGAHGHVHDLAALDSAGASHLTFCAGKKEAQGLPQSRAGFCFIGPGVPPANIPQGMIALPCAEAAVAFTAVAQMFYPEGNLAMWSQQSAIDPSARIADGVSLAPGVVIGPGVEIGERTRIGPNAVIGRGVAVGRDCEIGSNVSITHSYIGDHVLILPGAQIGQPGFGFNSSATGHTKTAQLGRVIVQDRVEIGACSTIDRGALGDTVIGEGTKIDNLVQIGHNDHLGRHCILAGQVGLSGSVELGDFVIMGGQVGAADHVKIGSGARFAGRAGLAPGEYAGGQDYGGYPVRAVRDWMRETAALSMLAKRRKNKDKDDE